MPNTTVSLSTMYFRRLYALTTKIWPIKDPHSLKMKKSNRWQVLRKIWTRHPLKFGSADILADALLYTVNPIFHKIFTPEQKLIIETIADLLLNDSKVTHDLNTAIQWKKTLTIALNKTRCFSDKYNEFVASCYRYAILNHFDLGIREDTDADLDIIVSFINIIHTIIPTSYQWSDSMWLDICNILATLYSNYNLDFSEQNSETEIGGFDNLEIFDIMLEICDHIINQKTSPPTVLLLINELTLPLTRVFWGNDTENILLDAYHEYIKEECDAYKNEQLLDPLAQRLIKTTFLYDLAYKWADDKTSPYYDKARKIIMDIMFAVPFELM